MEERKSVNDFEHKAEEEHSNIKLTNAKPTLSEIYYWHKNKKEITIKVRSPYTAKETTMKGVIALVGAYTSMIMLDTYQNVYLSEIIAYSEREEVKLIAEKDYAVCVSKIWLIDKCPYFERMIESGLTDSSLTEIDLSQTFNQKRLDILLKYLGDQKNEIQSLDDGLELLVAGDIVSSEKIIQHALKKISRRMDKDELFKLIREIDKLHPLIANWVKNVNEWLKKYPPNSYFSNFITNLPSEFLYSDNTNEYEKMMLACRQQLKNITTLDWSFDGKQLMSESNDTWHPDDPKHPAKYKSKVVRILIARGMLSGDKPHSKWLCKVTNAAALLTLDTQELRAELDDQHDSSTEQNSTSWRVS